jgi:hypothetical protein
MTRPLVEITMITFLIALWWVMHWVARLIVTEFGILGGLVACGVFFCTSLIMHHYDL